MNIADLVKIVDTEYYGEGREGDVYVQIDGVKRLVIQVIVDKDGDLMIVGGMR